MSREVRSRVSSERGVAGGRRVALTLEDGEHIPGILLHPVAAEPAPAALLLHGLTSRKEQMADSVGRALLASGVASLAIDLPLHGEREGSLESLWPRDLLSLARHWRLALEEAAIALRFLAAHPVVDGRRLALVGYSLGSYLGVIVAARTPAVRALVVAAGGDLPSHTPAATLVRAVADPIRAVRRYAGRPLLVVHGRRDRTVRPDQAQRLFDAAGEPKELRWWDAGHWLPAPAIADAAEWVAARLRETPAAAAPSRRAGA